LSALDLFYNAGMNTSDGGEHDGRLVSAAKVVVKKRAVAKIEDKRYYHKNDEM
jgi:hypothetical protein